MRTSCRHTTRLLVEQLGLRPEQWSFAYQSAGRRPGQWLGPAIEETLPVLAAQGMRHVLVTPVGFTGRPCGNFIRPGYRSPGDRP